MKTYLIKSLKYSISSRSYCLLEIYPEPLKVEEVSNNICVESYKTKNVLSYDPEDVLIEFIEDESGNHYKWGFNLRRNIKNPTMYSEVLIYRKTTISEREKELHYKIIEFPDDKTALLWFKLTF